MSVEYIMFISWNMISLLYFYFLLGTQKGENIWKSKKKIIKLLYLNLIPLIIFLIESYLVILICKKCNCCEPSTFPTFKKILFKKILEDC